MKPKNHPGKKQVRRLRAAKLPIQAPPHIADTTFRPGKKEREEAARLRCAVCGRKASSYAAIQDLQPDLTAICDLCVRHLALEGFLIQPIGKRTPVTGLTKFTALQAVVRLRSQQAAFEREQNAPAPTLAEAADFMRKLAGLGECNDPNCPIHGPDKIVGEKTYSDATGQPFHMPVDPSGKSN